MSVFWIVILTIFAVVFWSYQFIELMLLSDHEFPAAYDKPLWVLTFLCLPPLAPFLFIYWKAASAYLAEHKSDQVGNTRK